MTKLQKSKIRTNCYSHLIVWVSCIVLIIILVLLNFTYAQDYVENLNDIKKKSLELQKNCICGQYLSARYTANKFKYSFDDVHGSIRCHPVKIRVSNTIIKKGKWGKDYIDFIWDFESAVIGELNYQRNCEEFGITNLNNSHPLYRPSFKIYEAHGIYKDRDEIYNYTESDSRIGCSDFDFGVEFPSDADITNIFYQSGWIEFQDERGSDIASQPQVEIIDDLPFRFILTPAMIRDAIETKVIEMTFEWEEEEWWWNNYFKVSIEIKIGSIAAHNCVPDELNEWILGAKVTYGSDGPIPKACRSKIEQGISLAYNLSSNQRFIEVFQETVSKLSGKVIPKDAYLRALDKMIIHHAESSKNDNVQRDIKDDDATHRLDPNYKLPHAYAKVNGRDVWLRDFVLQNCDPNPELIAGIIIHEAAHLAGAPVDDLAELALKSLDKVSGFPR